MSLLPRASYADFLASQGLRFGFAAEIAACARKVNRGVANSEPPVALWPKIVPTARLLERVRARFGATRIHSAYRSPAYNATLDGSATDSQHTHHTALDFSCATGTPREWAAFLRAERANGTFTGGIGLYPTFVHVDTRGYRATWGGA